MKTQFMSNPGDILGLTCLFLWELKPPIIHVKTRKEMCKKAYANQGEAVRADRIESLFVLPAHQGTTVIILHFMKSIQGCVGPMKA